MDLQLLYISDTRDWLHPGCSLDVCMSCINVYYHTKAKTQNHVFNGLFIDSVALTKFLRLWAMPNRNQILFKDSPLATPLYSDSVQLCFTSTCFHCLTVCPKPFEFSHVSRPKKCMQLRE